MFITLMKSLDWKGCSKLNLEPLLLLTSTLNIVSVNVKQMRTINNSKVNVSHSGKPEHRFYSE